jgi:hypothetical protein
MDIISAYLHCQAKNLYSRLTLWSGLKRHATIMGARFKFMWQHEGKKQKGGKLKGLHRFSGGMFLGNVGDDHNCFM